MNISDQRIARDLISLRYRQQIINELLKKGAFGGLPVHVAIGHEAIAVAVNHAMKENDQLVLTHRNMHFNLARRDELECFLNEYRQNQQGIAQGRLGSMNMAQPSAGLPYTSSILGNNMPVACGFALAQSVKNKGGVVWVNTGDGAMEEGTFYETLVFAKTQKLRLIFVIENNNMSMSSLIHERRCEIDIQKMASAFDVPYLSLKGNFVLEYTQKISHAREQVMSSSGPLCIEVQTHSYSQHAGPTPGWPTDPKKITIETGMIVEESDRDALFILSQKIPPEIRQRLEAEVIQQFQGFL